MCYEYRKFRSRACQENRFKASGRPRPRPGVPAAIGYAEQSKKKFELGLIRNHYVGRTFIELTQNISSLEQLKLSSTKTVVKINL